MTPPATFSFISCTMPPMSRPRMNTPIAETRCPSSRLMFMLPPRTAMLVTSPSGTRVPDGVSTSTLRIAATFCRSRSRSRTATPYRRSPSQISVPTLPPSAVSITSSTSATLSPYRAARAVHLDLQLRHFAGAIDERARHAAHARHDSQHLAGLLPQDCRIVAEDLD